MRPSRPISRLLGRALPFALLFAQPTLAQQISAGKSGTDEAAHLHRIASNKKRHYACAVSIATKKALETKAAADAVVAAAFRGCREFELEYRRLLENGAPTTNGRVALVSPKVVSLLIEIRKRELRPSIAGAIKEVR